jgi:hypothetical protein
MARAVEIEWASASVEDAQLSVSLSHPRPKGWSAKLESVLAQLGGHGRGWGDVSLGKRKLQVDGLTPGAEEDLRHFLESAVLQANAAAGVQQDDDEDDEPSGPDEEMTAVFRSFAD